MAQLSLTYLDECLRVDVIYTHEEYYSATIGPSDSVAIRLTLNTLGGTLAAPAMSRAGSR
jgi:LPS-assembly protein